MPVLLNPRHELFAQNLAKGVAASTAYVNAGYKEDPANASRLTLDDKVKSRVQELQELAAKKVGVTIERVVVELAKIGFCDIRKAVRWGFEMRPAPRKRG